MYRVLLVTVLLLAGVLTTISTQAQGGKKGGKKWEREENNLGKMRSNKQEDHEMKRNRTAEFRNRREIRENNRNFRNEPVNASANRRPTYGTVNRPAYRPNYRYDRIPVYDARNPGWRYGYLPRRNSYFYSVPASYLYINFGGLTYRYWDGVFYRPHNKLFVVIAPPPGIFIRVLPVGYRRIIVRDYPYYYYNGTYYDQHEDHYNVIPPPVGAVVESLPAGYETVVIDGETYYKVDDTQYKPVVQQNGEIWYEVIKSGY